MTSGSSWAGALGPRSVMMLPIARGARRLSTRGQVPATAAPRSASTAGGLATSNTSARRWRAPHRVMAYRQRRLTTAPRQMSAPRHPPAAGGNNKRPPPPKKPPRAGPSRGGGQPRNQFAFTSGATTTGRKRARDPTMTSGSTPPNKQATGSTRFSYAAAMEGGKRVVLDSLDGIALTKEDPRLLGEAVNR